MSITDCPHPDFYAKVEVVRLEDSNQFQAHIRIGCTKCYMKFVFVGLSNGLDLGGAARSFDGLEARLAIVPESMAKEDR